ncbi:RNA methyltransferase [Sedimentibacter sp. zth1]|uniref:TrmH family RNA methyltransferase n=1 Tax=Sedimentibacter sp. zth1 TaxID=2816908 RepID=UPI001A918768|nr:RNA methyltransferase [Sedimentibacter sp. zth1]QSX06140.1 RNA methyltransferase [Sedimentibacter sp. zth1]
METKKNRDINSAYIVESIKLIKEAINEKVLFKFVLISDSIKEKKDIKYVVNILEKSNIEYYYVKSDVFKDISNTVTSQGIVAVVDKKKIDIKDILTTNFLVFCDKLQDPGNLGTIVRTADAFGPCSVVLSPCCVDAYNAKTVRACAGAIYRANVFEIKDSVEFLTKMKASGYKVISTVVDSNLDFDNIKELEKICLVIGNEGNGVSDEVKQLSDLKITIKMTGNTESLNASIAAGISIYEIRKKLL